MATSYSDARPARLVVLTVALLHLACGVGPPEAAPGQAAAPATAPAGAPRGEAAEILELRFFDVGQGDAVLIRAPDGRSVLYDGGQDGGLLLRHLEEAGVDSLELVIASHNHADHIGGLVDVIERYRPRFVLENGIPHTTRTYERFLRAVAAAGSQRLAPTRRVITLGPVRLTVIPPPGDPALGHNDNSLGLRVEHGAFAATLLGDSQPAQQAWWLEHHGDLLAPVAVHKASHHGSRNGDTRRLLETLRGGVVVIGVGVNNQYGHPHPDVLALHAEFGAEVYRTDRDGTVTVLAERDGTVEVRSERGLVGRDCSGRCAAAPLSDGRPPISDGRRHGRPQAFR